MWSVADAKTHLSEGLRRARAGEPQFIGERRSCVVIFVDLHRDKVDDTRGRDGRWLIAEAAKVKGGILIPSRHGDRPELVGWTPIGKTKRDGCEISHRHQGHLRAVPPGAEPLRRRFPGQCRNILDQRHGASRVPVRRRSADRSQAARALGRVSNASVQTLSAGALPIGVDVDDTASRLRARAKRSGRVLTMSDALIAATSLTHGLILATRNVKDFADLDVPLVDPFEPA